MHAMESAVRNPTKIHADLVVVNGGKAIMTKGGCYIYTPVGFISKELAFIGNTIEIIGLYAISTDRKTFGVSQATALMEITPTSYEEVLIQDEPYYEFRFEPGTVVIPNRDLPILSAHVFNVTSYFYDYGRRPFWVLAEDDAEVLSGVRRWNGITVFDDQTTADIFVAHTQRDPKDVHKFYRHSLRTAADLNKPPLYVPMRDGPLNKTSRLAKIADVELKRGIRSALNVEPVRPEPLEDLYMR